MFSSVSVYRVRVRDGSDNYGLGCTMPRKPCPGAEIVAESNIRHHNDTWMWPRLVWAVRVNSLDMLRAVAEENSRKAALVSYDEPGFDGLLTIP